MKNILKDKLFIWGIVFLCCFTVLAVAVAFGWTQEFDRAVIETIYRLRGSHSEPEGVFFWINRIVTEAGFIYVLIPACLIALIVGKFRFKALALALGTGVTWLLNNGCKLLFVRERPDMMYRMMTEHSSSFPSGHSMTSAFFYFFLAYLISKSPFHPRVRRTLSSISMVIPFLVGLTRINLSVHYPTDVAAGLFFGGALACFARLAIEQIPNHRNQKKTDVK